MKPLSLLLGCFFFHAKSCLTALHYLLSPFRHFSFFLLIIFFFFFFTSVPERNSELRRDFERCQLSFLFILFFSLCARALVEEEAHVLFTLCCFRQTAYLYRLRPDALTNQTSYQRDLFYFFFFFFLSVNIIDFNPPALVRDTQESRGPVVLRTPAPSQENPAHLSRITHRSCPTAAKRTSISTLFANRA
ncbi:hypothetical protein J3F83DRAFT_158611 [Trichoderma novae-zelandiae]